MKANKIYPNTDCEISNSVELGINRKESSITPMELDSDAETKKKGITKNDYKRFSLQPVAEANLVDESKYNTIIDPAISIDSSKPPAVPDVSGLSKQQL